MNKRIVSILTPTLLSLAALLSSCGSSEVVLRQQPGMADQVVPAEEPTPEPDDSGGNVVKPDIVEGPMLVLHESGGCFMAGAECRIISFWADGRVLVTPGESDSSDESYLIDPAMATSWLATARETDIDDLVGRLPEGECRGCVDGIDLVLDLDLGDRQVTLDSMVVEFVQSEPLFAATYALVESIPYTLGEPMLSSDPTGWNTPIEPALVIDGIPATISTELPVVQFPGRALGGGILDAGASIVAGDADYIYLGVGGTRGCATFEHLALVPTDVAGIYELFHDTDNTCEAAGVTGYRTPRADLTPDLDGVITITNGNGTTSTFALD